MSETTRRLISGGRVICLAGAVREAAVDILIDHDRIVAIAPRIQATDAQMIDATGCIVLPGFVDTHRHVWQTQLRSAAADWSLFDYLVRMRLIYSSFYEPEDVYLGNHVGALEALNAGVTTVVDHCHIINSPEHADAAVRGLQDAHGRAVFCYGLFCNPRHDPFRLEEDATWRRANARRIREQILASDSARVTFGLAPNEVESLPFEASADEIRFARELGARRISFHVAMGAYDQRNRFVERLGAANLLAADMLFVHGAALTDHELALIRDHGASISSTPETELQMGMGFPVADRVRQAGGIASLGIDIVSNYSGDMFAQMRLLLQVTRALRNAELETNGKAPRHIEPRVEDVLRMATSGGANAAGLDHEVGSLEVGKQADIVLIRTDTLNTKPATSAVGTVVLSANSGDVDTVLVAGRIVKRHGQLVGVNRQSLLDRLAESYQRIAARAGKVDARPIEQLVARWFPNLAD